MNEGIEKRSFCSYFLEKFKNTLGYFGDNSTLHGVRYVFSLSFIPFYKRIIKGCLKDETKKGRHKNQKIFWLIILSVSATCAGFVMRQVLSLYSGGAVSYLIETDYLEFDTPFPAVTICEQMNSEKVSAYLRDNTNAGFEMCLVLSLYSKRSVSYSTDSYTWISTTYTIVSICEQMNSEKNVVLDNPFFERRFCWFRVRQVLSLYSGGAVFYLIETEYQFETPFPAFTICEQMNSEKVSAYLKGHKLPSTLVMFLKDVVYLNAKVCKICATCKPWQTCIEDFHDIVNAVRSSCKEILTDCWWNDQHFSCCERFLPVKTEYGVCFVFNSRVTGNETSLIVNNKIGLPNLVFHAIQEVGIRIHSPDDVVSVGMENPLGKPVVLPLITDYELILKAEETISDKSVLAMPPKVRGCLFNDERPSFMQGSTSPYSYSTCMLYCRAVWQIELCNCTHHFMPKIGNARPCDIQGLVCLTKNKEQLGAGSCDCPMSCQEVTYKPVHDFKYRHSGKISPAIAARGTRGLVRLAQLPASRVRRTAIRHTLGLVVDIGGVGGVFFGASLLNVIEIIYLLCIRRKQ